MGGPTLGDEEMVTIAFKETRSQFMREALDRALAIEQSVVAWRSRSGRRACAAHSAKHFKIDALIARPLAARAAGPGDKCVIGL